MIRTSAAYVALALVGCGPALAPEPPPATALTPVTTPPAPSAPAPAPSAHASMAAAEPADPPKKSTYDEYAAVLARERASTIDSSALDKLPEIPPPTSAAKPAGTRAWKCQGLSRAAVAAAVEKEYGPDTMVGTSPTTVRVTVTAEGKPKSVSVVSGGEFGYGAAAQRCAMRQRYEPGHDEAGQAIASTTPPILVILSER